MRTVAAEAGRAVAVLADLPGPKIRTGHFPDGGVELVGGSLLRLRPGDGPSDAGLIQIPYETLLTICRSATACNSVTERSR